MVHFEYIFNMSPWKKKSRSVHHALATKAFSESKEAFYDGGCKQKKYNVLNYGKLFYREKLNIILK